MSAYDIVHKLRLLSKENVYNNRKDSVLDWSWLGRFLEHRIFCNCEFQWRPNLPELQGYMSTYNCKDTFAKIHLQRYNCKDTIARIQSQRYNCKDTIAKIQLQRYMGASKLTTSCKECAGHTTHSKHCREFWWCNLPTDVLFSCCRS